MIVFDPKFNVEYLACTARHPFIFFNIFLQIYAQNNTHYDTHTHNYNIISLYSMSFIFCGCHCMYLCVYLCHHVCYCVSLSVVGVLTCMFLVVYMSLYMLSCMRLLVYMSKLIYIKINKHLYTTYMFSLFICVSKHETMKYV